MKAFSTTIFYFLFSLSTYAQNSEAFLRQQYQASQQIVSKSFKDYFNQNVNHIYSLKEDQFISVVDSLRYGFQRGLTEYKAQVKDKEYVENEEISILFFFDKLILDYPYFHEINTGERLTLSPAVQKRLDKNLIHLNNPKLLNHDDVKQYIIGFLRHQSSIELQKPAYKKSDNKRLVSTLTLLPKYFTNKACWEYWNYYFLNYHLEEFGVKNLEEPIKKFHSFVKDSNYVKRIDSLYTNGMNQRKNHLIKPYKIVDSYKLDMHLFLPEGEVTSKKRPAIVYFNGGGWTQGNPEWSFYNCAGNAKEGWVAVTVEYRLADRHNTTPFEAVMDARSAIRWLRKHANEYGIDTNRIAATGNSAGGHLALATVMADKWNEKTDALSISAAPNVLLINSGVYDLMGDANTRWIAKDLQDKNLIKEISPLHLIKPGLPPMLLIHGTDDRNVPYSTAKAFADAMKNSNNDFEFQTLEGAPHFIWYDERYASKVSALRYEFLKKHGY
jgi:acetyl esterase/lipase